MKIRMLGAMCIASFSISVLFLLMLLTDLIYVNPIHKLHDSINDIYVKMHYDPVSNLKQEVLPPERMEGILTGVETISGIPFIYVHVQTTDKTKHTFTLCGVHVPVSQIHALQDLITFYKNYKILIVSRTKKSLTTFAPYELVSIKLLLNTETIVDLSELLVTHGVAKVIHPLDIRNELKLMYSNLNRCQEYAQDHKNGIWSTVQ